MFTVLPAFVLTSHDCVTKPLAAPVCPDVVPIIAPMLKSCEPSITALPSSLAPTAKSPVPTGQDIDNAISRIEVVPAGAIKERFESPKLLVNVT